jgi:anti-anti-sigma factor
MSPDSQLIRPLPGSITIEDEGSRRVLCLRGDLDSAVVAQFQAHQEAQPLVVDAIDAGAVSFLSSTGLAVMLRCAEASVAAGRKPVLRASSPPVDRLLQLAGMEHAFLRPHSVPEPADNHR